MGGEGFLLGSAYIGIKLVLHHPSSWHAQLPVNMASQQRDASMICLFDVDGTLTAPRQVSHLSYI